MKPELFDVANTVVLISGGSRGIGYAFAEAFALQGARVVITGRNEQSLIEACEGMKTHSHPVTYQTCDVADDKAIAACVDAVIAEHGRIDTLINCAGVNKRMPATEYTAEEYDQIMNINLRGSFLMSQAVGKQMITQRSGNVINIDSLSTYGGLTHIVPYAMSKSGLGSMTRGLALEWGKYGVRINGLAPGFILTDLTNELWSSSTLQSWHKATSPIKRLGHVDDLIGTAVFLASPGAAYITGQVIRVDGGISAGIKWPIENDFEVKINEE